jgi:hypothetical protein
MATGPKRLHACIFQGYKQGEVKQGILWNLLSSTLYGNNADHKNLLSIKILFGSKSILNHSINTKDRRSKSLGKHVFDLNYFLLL